jgi:septum formation protein
VNASTVVFNPFTQTAIDSLLAEGTVLKCAGGIMIEHDLVRPFIRHLEGSEDGIQGLPKHLTTQLIEEAEEELE